MLGLRWVYLGLMLNQEQRVHLGFRAKAQMNTCFWGAVGEMLGLCGTCWGNFGKMNGLFFWALYHFEVMLGPSWSY